jgi:signal peptidase
MSALPTETPKKESKVRKKDIIIGVVLIGVALFGTFGFFEIMKASLHTDIPMVVVTSGSMVPTIYKGDLLIVEGKDPAEIQNGSHTERVGDIIIYDAQGLWTAYLPEGNQPIVHRVIGKYYNTTDNKYYFITQGDANYYPDPPMGPPNIPVPEDHVLGVVKTVIPKVGWVKIWLSETNLGIPIIVILGALLIISIIYDIMHPEKEEEDEKKEALKKLKKLEKIENQVHSNASHSDNKDLNLGI